MGIAHRLTTAPARVLRGLAVRAWMQRQLRRRRAARVEDEPRFVIWPPIRTRQEYADVKIRVQWLYPLPAASRPLVVPVTRAFTDVSHTETGALMATRYPKCEIELAVGSDAWDAAMAGAQLLIWKFFDRRGLVPAYTAPGWMIDPHGYGTVEESEWLMLFERYTPSDVKRKLEEESAQNLRRLLAERGSPACANVCGNGPSIERVFAESMADAFNVVCNSAIQSERLMDHVRPAAVALMSSPDFGPSLYGHRQIAAAARSIERHGSYVFVREGFPHYLLATNYPEIRGHLIGLGPAREFGRPTPEQPVARGGKNVLTSLMLPAALAVRPARVAIWGCDGYAASEISRRRQWSYAVPLTPDASSVAAAHPAMHRDHRNSPAMRARRYDHHCQTVRDYLFWVEAAGTPVVCRTPSNIPALRERQRL